MRKIDFSLEGKKKMKISFMSEHRNLSQSKAGREEIKHFLIGNRGISASVGCYQEGKRKKNFQSERLSINKIPINKYWQST